MDTGLDTGDVFAEMSTAISGKTSETLHLELSLLGAELLISTLADIEKGTAIRKKQHATEASYAPLIQKEDGLVDFNKSPAVIERLVRGLYPWPSAYTTFEGEMVKIVEAEDLKQLNPAKAGTISRITEMGLEVSAGGGTLLIKKVQFPGKKPMLVTDYLRGNKIAEGALLGPHTI
jgi:methionyl-tRNA formyltransferase